MNKPPLMFVILMASFITVAVPSTWAANVSITPLGSYDGEFCRLDRALIFEDPDRTRILYDAGRTVRGPDDPRLVALDAVLLSHVHGDHLGDKHTVSANAGTRGKLNEPTRQLGNVPRLPRWHSAPKVSPF